MKIWVGVNWRSLMKRWMECCSGSISMALREAKRSKVSWYLSMMSPGSLIQTSVDGGIASSTGICSLLSKWVWTFGMILTRERLRWDNCVRGSNKRMLSTSTSKSSTRNGHSFPNEKISIMPPLMENCPGSYTKSTLSKPISTSKEINPSTPRFSPFLI